MSDSIDPGACACSRFGWPVLGDGFHDGECLECAGCGTVYVAVAGDRPIRTEDDARCLCCRAVLTDWPQPVSFEIIETADEACPAGSVSASAVFRSGRLE